MVVAGPSTTKTMTRASVSPVRRSADVTLTRRNTPILYRKPLRLPQGLTGERLSHLEPELVAYHPFRDVLHANDRNLPNAHLRSFTNGDGQRGGTPVFGDARDEVDCDIQKPSIEVVGAESFTITRGRKVNVGSTAGPLHDGPQFRLRHRMLAHEHEFDRGNFGSWSFGDVWIEHDPGLISRALRRHRLPIGISFRLVVAEPAILFFDPTECLSELFLIEHIARANLQQFFHPGRGERKAP